MPFRRAVALALPLSLASSLALTSCGPAADTTPATPGQLNVVTSFYPLEYLTTRIAGDHAVVSSLTGAGVDPHEVELTPRVVGSLSSADLVIYSGGLQPAVDAAVQEQAVDHSLDTSTAIELAQADQPGAPTESGAVAHEHEHADEHQHGEGGLDPHFWLDPELYGQVATAIEERLASLDPTHAQDYQTNLAELRSDLSTLDEDFAEGLAQCAHRDLVTTHEAFGYLARRYHLHEIGITGLAPDTEPSPTRLAEVTRDIRAQGITTIFAEPLLSDAIARTVAHETGATVLVLDPVEGLSSASSGSTYFEIMRANLASLQEGLGCS